MSCFPVLDLVLLALVVIVVAYLPLQIGGVLAPGWPPRRASCAPAVSPEARAAPPATGEPGAESRSGAPPG